MKKFFLPLIFLIIVSLSISPILIQVSAQENVLIPPRKQWKELSDIDQLTCKEGLLLLQKNNGAPACVSSTAYLRLVDRGYGMFDSQIMMKRPMMMNNLMETMTTDQTIMSHWHDMMLDDKIMLQKTMHNWISQMKENPEYLSNMLGPMTSNPDLREKMIEEMKQHSEMMNTLQAHPRWMDSVHDDMRPGMGQGMHMGSGQTQGMHMANCPWCPEFEMHHMHDHSGEFSHSNRMMDMMHHMWINEEMTTDMHEFMLRNPSHMAHMSQQMMGPMLGFMMDDPEIRQQMIDLMLEHQEFMNSIRHENKTNN